MPTETIWKIWKKYLTKDKESYDISLHRTKNRLVWLFVIWALLFLFVFEVFFITTRVILEDRFQKEEFVTQIRSLIEWRPLQERWRKWVHWKLDINSAILNRDGDILELRGNVQVEEFSGFIEKNILKDIPEDTIVSYSGTLLLKKRQKIGNEDYTVLFFKKSIYQRDGIARDILRFLVMNIFLILPFYFIGQYYVGRILRPVAENINNMSHFIHDAGHELKTPLAIISGNLQILRDSKIPNKDIIEESISTIRSMWSSIDWLVELVSLQAPIHTTTLYLKDSIQEILMLHHEQIEKQDITLTLDIPESAQISIEKKHLQILLSNLITNAIRYNKYGGDISIKIKWKRLTITDTGIGMTETETRRVFERFYRADRTGKTPGTGIWLAIVERIVRLYGWIIEVKSEKWIGTSFMIDMK